MRLTKAQQDLVDRIKARRAERTSPRAVTPRMVTPTAKRAARYAHNHVTRVCAARKFGTSTNAVIAAWELLYPSKRRDLT